MNKLNKFDELYKLIMEDTKNPNLGRMASSDSWKQKGDRIEHTEGACGSHIATNKTYDKWVAENQKKVYKKHDFDPNQTYEPVLSEINGNATKPVKGSELEAIKAEYKGSTRHQLELSMYYFYEDPSDPHIGDSEYDFKDIVTIDEENFYLNRAEKTRSGISKRKAFYVVISKNTDRGEGGTYSMEDLEDSDWLIRNSSTIEYFTQGDVEPYFDGKSGKGRIKAEITTKAGEEDKLEEVKAKMIEMANNLLEQKNAAEKEKRSKYTPAQKNRHNATRERHIQERLNSIETYKNEIKRLEQEIEKIKADMIS